MAVAQEQSSPFWRTLQRCTEVVREGGWRSLLAKALQEMGVHRRLILFDVPLGDPPPSTAPSIPLQARLLTRDDLDEYLAFRPDSDPRVIRSRFEEGHQCFSAWQSDRLVSAIWVARQRARLDYLDREIALAQDEAYSYDSFTMPALRGMQVASAHTSAMRRGLRETGLKRLLGAVVPENRSSLRRAEKRKHQRIGMIGYWKLGPWRRDFIRMDPGHPPPGDLRELRQP